MAFKLIPTEEKFFELFEAQAAKNVEAAKVFKDLVENWDLKSPAFARLRDIEHEADRVTHDLKDRLNRTFVTPFDREDIHELASELDDVVDFVESLAARMKLYRVERKDAALTKMADILLQACENVERLVAEIHHKSSYRRALDLCIEINRNENAGDLSLHDALESLFGGKPDPLEVIKWKEIYETIEEAIDKCEDIANTVESILIKQS